MHTIVTNVTIRPASAAEAAAAAGERESGGHADAAAGERPSACGAAAGLDQSAGKCPQTAKKARQPAPSAISEEDGTSQGGACADVEAVAAVIEQPSSGDALCFTCQLPVYKVRHSVAVGVLPVRSLCVV